MSQNKTAGYNSLSRILLTASALILLMVYNNCSGLSTYPYDESKSNRKMATSENINQGLASLSSAQCLDEKNYVCEWRRYSMKYEQSVNTHEFPCVELNDGSTVCNQGLELRYNSGETTDVTSNPENEYEEYFCYYYDEQAQKGLVFIEERDADYTKAATSVIQQCLDLVEGAR